MQEQPTLYLLMGYPGAGKTTVAKYIHQKTGAVHLWADQERQALYVNPSHSIQESEELYDLLDIKTKSLLTAGNSVIFDTNFNYFSDREKMRNIAKETHASTKLIWLTTSKTIAKERALHHTHRDQNGYLVTMTETEFENLSNHLEKPKSSERPIKINGADLDYLKLSQQLGI